VSRRCGYRSLGNDAVDAQRLPVGDHVFAGDPDVVHCPGTCGPHKIGEQLLVGDVESRPYGVLRGRRTV